VKKPRIEGRCAQAFLFAVVIAAVTTSASTNRAAFASGLQERSTPGSLTPLQLEIEKQQIRLGSPAVEERRDAITQLGSMHHPAASRAALAGLRDPLAIVRATAASAILSLPAEESAASLIPLLSDKDEFVRREAAYALGRTRRQSAVSHLVHRLLSDKTDEVRGAAAVALGQIGSLDAVSSLSGALVPQLEMAGSKNKKKVKREQNSFVLRSAARSLGQIGNSSALPVLLAVLQDTKAEPDVRREAASALGVIGDRGALPALRVAVSDADPYVSLAANDAIMKILRANLAATR
jgi:HEAT repeat protein